MKCLSLQQPWATPVVLGAKKIETRKWQTRHRGPLLIHASRNFERAARDLCYHEPFKSVLLRAGYDPPSQLPLGALIGRVEVKDCVSVAEVELAEPEASFGDFRPGRWCWLLGNAEKFNPVEWKGHLSLFDIPEELLVKLLLP